MIAPARVKAVGVSKIFGSFRALDDVAIEVPSGSFHAIVGENGAGKSTLAKCLLGFYRPDSGTVKLDGNLVTTPSEARRAGLGMVFQHFTLAPSLTVAENLVLARTDLPALIDWSGEKARLRAFLERAPFDVNLDARIQDLAAGQKQKVEILKQLYLETRVLILDEPTSVLTPGEADEVMGVLSKLVRAGSLSVLLVTHKLREVMGFADQVTVLRRGRLVGHANVSETDVPSLTAKIMGDAKPAESVERQQPPSTTPALQIRDLTVLGNHGLPAVKNASFTLNAGEILGVAGVSGNGQRELVQALAGQREIESGAVLAHGIAFEPSSDGIRRAGMFTLPEEPLQNACVPGMSVAENLALRSFDREPSTKFGFLLDAGALRRAADALIARFSIRASSPEAPIRELSGGNVQRAVLARDLGANEARIFVVANPCFGLDLGATAFVHNQLMELRNRGGSVLLIGEDLDEVLKLSDRIAVMSGGEIVHQAARAELDVAAVGRYMGGH